MLVIARWLQPEELQLISAVRVLNWTVFEFEP